MIFTLNDIQIQPAKGEDHGHIFSSYCASFPADERRDEEQFYKLLENRHCKILSIFKGENLAGYLIVWEFSEFTFIEHFEIFETLRGANLGSTILSILTENLGNIVLETEPKELSDIAERRVGFYKKNGFSVLDESYIQPSYSQDKNPLNLWLMGTFEPDNLTQTIAEIHKIVYQN